LTSPQKAEGKIIINDLFLKNQQTYESRKNFFFKHLMDYLLSQKVVFKLTTITIKKAKRSLWSAYIFNLISKFDRRIKKLGKLKIKVASKANCFS